LLFAEGGASIPDHQGKSGIRGVAFVVTPRMSKKERGFDAIPAELVQTWRWGGSKRTMLADPDGKGSGCADLSVCQSRCDLEFRTGTDIFEFHPHACGDDRSARGNKDI
jgi:hypothetical protein